MNDEPHRVGRGGGWDVLPSSARVAIRVRLAPGNRYNNLGLRLVRVVLPIQQIAEVKNG